MPEPSARTTGMILVFGIRFLSEGFSLRITGFRHDVIVPVKIPVSAFESSCRLLIRFPAGVSRLYMMAVPPATVGRYWKVLCSPFSCCSSAGRNGMSESPKSTWFSM